MNKPWSIMTFPKDRPIYVRPKQAAANVAGGGSLVVTFGVPGVAVLDDPKRNLTPVFKTMTWIELFLDCEQWDGQPCGEKV